MLIHSDEWGAYGKLKQYGFYYFTVNHLENFVNPNSGKNTQLVECLWIEYKSYPQLSTRKKFLSSSNLFSTGPINL